jgi:hypothetical protein
MPFLKRLALIAGIAAVAIAIPATVLASYADRQWSLYTASDQDPAYHLFLDPFPDEHSCEVDAKVVRRNGGKAECRSRYVLAFDRGLRDRLAWEFIGPANPFARLCSGANGREVRVSAGR